MLRKFGLPGGAISAAVICIFTFVAMLVPSSADDRAMVLPVDPAPLVAETSAGEHSFSIEIADDPQERSAGLMFRETMDDDHGMLFVFEQTQPVGFWMKNTPLPLDLIFIGQDGRVKEIHRGEPFSEAPIASQEEIRFVLELKQGTAQRVGVKEGDLVRHPTITRVMGAG
ncbi:DUF192 domain-containing protein [Pseudaminobacter arsenicus]|uniref:DUF192 domain-containing protein n=1 Tax=Borborobacter arsenicus TaxID=1851146 RepID=A0A432V985_9HYPH|nr:DUF192 domain-containing protein [Pseudaminobacter arsenicus]